MISVFLLMAGFAIPVKTQAAELDSKAGIVATSGGRLNVRSSPSTSAGVVASLGKGSYVTLISQSGSWWKVEYASGKFGYCHGDYITLISGTAAKVATKSSSLNVRSGPGTSYSRVGSLAKGETVIVLSASNGWSRILYHGSKTGYVSAQYLSENYPAITLNVPNYKQTDSRWADVQIGESGKTFSQIGCATTAIAMMESFRTGSTIYPDAMSRQLQYTTSGSVYWPAHYQTVTDPSGYLSGIYSRLQQGKPVLLGMKNSAGKQHWVVVYGFSGGASLNAASFLIRDPGTTTRTNLQQLVDLHPIFYKYFCY